MDNQQHQKQVHTPGHDGSGHGVYVCHKCGWPFPNPHPSAKHRRAHKRICGTIEGYKVLDLEGSFHSYASDDDRLSDEDHKTPSPKVMEAGSNEKGSGGTGVLPNRSEEDVFSDAATDFTDSGLGSGAQERLVDAGKSAIIVEKIVKSESNTIQSSEGGPIAETIEPLGSATGSIQIHHSETPDNTSNGSGNAPKLIETSSRCIASSVIDSVSDCRTEDSDLLLNGNKYASLDDLHTKEAETQKDMLEESEKTDAIDYIVDGSLTMAEKGTDVEGKRESSLDSNLPDLTISSVKVDGDTAEVMSKSDAAVKTNLEPLSATPEDGLVQLQEKHTDGFHLKIPEHDVSTEVESVEHVNASKDTAETEVDSAKGINDVNSGNLIEEKGKADANFLELSVPDDLHVIDNPEIMLEDFKDHKAMEVDQSATLECEQANDKGVDTKGLVLEERSLNLQSNQSEESVVFVSDRHVLEDSVQLDQGRSMPTVKDVPVEEQADLSQIKVKITESQRSDEIATPSDVVVPLPDKSAPVSSPKGQESYDVCSETSQDNVSQNAKTLVSDEASAIALGNAGIVEATHLVGVEDHANAYKSDFSEDYDHIKGTREDDYAVSPVTATESASNGSNIKVDSATNLQDGDATSYEKVELGRDDLTADGPAKESFSENLVATPESTEKLSEQINLENNLQKGDDAGNYEKFAIQKDFIAGDACDAAAGEVKDETGVDNSDGPTKESFSEHAVVTPDSANKSSELYANHEKDNIEKCVEHGIETKEGPVEEYRPVQQKTTPESASHLQESHTVAEEVVFGSVEKSPDIGCTNVGSAPDLVGVNVASDTQLGMIEHKLDGSDKVQHTVDNNVKEPTLSPLHTESSIQSSTAGVFDSASESFQGASDRQLLGGSVIDLSVDSLSLTDSLEGNWGSVSVLSIQSDAQAVIDAETLPPTESHVVKGEKNNSNQSKPVSDGQHPDKSEMFEPPSFMTLVEPVGGSDQKAATSEIQTGQNSQQPNSSSLQAGWFPSITNVVNESQGRKKNEEIINKVANWSTGKPQHTPLKSLLGEASLETIAKSPKRKENVAPDLQKGDKSATTVNSILAPESPLGQVANREIGKEWNSPARYPAEIKREKRKSRPYWAQFVCCSTVH